MTTIVTRQGKGSPLSWVEADANFTNLNTDKAENSVVALKAPLASPDLTGVPTAPTATNGTNTTQLATTAFVQAKTASQTPSTAIGNIVATNVQAALEELDMEKAPALAGVPSGAIMDFAMTAVPAGWLQCDGAAVSRTTYAELFAAIGTAWGVGDGSTTFNLPDARGRYRAMAGTDGTAVSKTFGQKIADLFKSHNHSGASQGAGGHGHYDSGHIPAAADGSGYSIQGGVSNTNIAIGSGFSTNMNSVVTSTGFANIVAVADHVHNIFSDGSTETRPYSIVVQTCIKV